MTRDNEPRLGPAEPTGFQWLEGAPAGAEEQTTQCPRCGAVVGAQSFCESCGASLQAADGAATQLGDGVQPAGGAAPGEAVGPAGDGPGVPGHAGTPPGPDAAAPQEGVVSGGVGPLPGGDAAPPEGARGPAGMLVLGGGSAQEMPVVGGASGDLGVASASGPGGLGSPADLGVLLPLPNGGICADCGGTFDGDGYCEQCGAKAADPRHHFEVAAGPWVGGVCDQGVRHPGNEDALALRAQPSPTGGLRAALVVCDGVSTAPRSAQASLAAAHAAVEVLAASRARGMGVKEALVGALGQRLEAATDAANEAVVAVGALPPGPDDEPSRYGPESGGPSCTIVAAAVEDGLAVIGNVGDSRAYWFPDHGEPTLLTCDDSWAAEAIRAGATREEAETGPHAHTITRWLGPDAPDHTPVATALDVTEPGWLLLCSDGLWNYASEPAQLAAVLADALAGGATRREADDVAPSPADGVPPSGAADGLAPPEAADGVEPSGAADDVAAHADGQGAAGDGPVAFAQRLVDWANAQGGHDNITVALARLFPDRSGVDPLTADVEPSHGPRGGEASFEERPAVTEAGTFGVPSQERPPQTAPAGTSASPTDGATTGATATGATTTGAGATGATSPGSTETDARGDGRHHGEQG